MFGDVIRGSLNVFSLFPAPPYPRIGLTQSCPRAKPLMRFCPPVASVLGLYWVYVYNLDMNWACSCFTVTGTKWGTVFCSQQQFCIEPAGLTGVLISRELGNSTRRSLIFVITCIHARTFAESPRAWNRAGRPLAKGDSIKDASNMHRGSISCTHNSRFLDAPENATWIIRHICCCTIRLRARIDDQSMLSPLEHFLPPALQSWSMYDMCTFTTLLSCNTWLARDYYIR